MRSCVEPEHGDVGSSWTNGTILSTIPMALPKPESRTRHDAVDVDRRTKQPTSASLSSISCREYDALERSLVEVASRWITMGRLLSRSLVSADGTSIVSSSFERCACRTGAVQRVTMRCNARHRAVTWTARDGSNRDRYAVGGGGPLRPFLIVAARGNGAGCGWDDAGSLQPER
jgi:hypothetical protein